MGQEYKRLVDVISSIPSWGNVLLYDDFEKGFHFSPTGTGVDWIAELSQKYQHIGSNSLHLVTRYTGAALNDTVTVYRWTGFPSSGKFRFNCFFHHNSDSYVKTIKFRIQALDGTNMNAADLIYDPVAHKWTYATSADVENDVPGGSQNLAVEIFHKLSWEADFINSKYGAFICDNLEIDMSAISCHSGANAFPRYFQIIITAKALTTTPAQVFLDNLLIEII